MFLRILKHKGFWKSVVSLAIAFVVLFILAKWAIDGFDTSFFKEQNPILFYPGTILAGFLYGFFVTYGKFWNKLKQEDLKNK